VMPTREALGMATEQGLDLVEVAPAADPPVCRLMDYGKHRYEATRKEREARKVQKTRVTNQLREVRFRTRIGDHDRNAKTRLVHRLLNQGSKVKVSVLFRGREITHPDLGMTVLRSVAEDLAENALMEKPPGFEGRALTMILSPKPIKVVKTKAEEEPGDSPEPAKAEAGAGDSPKAPRAGKGRQGGEGRSGDQRPAQGGQGRRGGEGGRGAKRCQSLRLTRARRPGSGSRARESCCA
jgi:translation initiation factor IF-3